MTRDPKKNRDPRNGEPAVRPELRVSTIRTQLRGASHWCFMHSLQARADPNYRPCFHAPLMREMGAYIQAVAQHVARQVAVSADHLAHVVIASDSDVFNLGGDLELFARLIRGRDRDALLRYATECVEGVHLLYAHVHPNIHTVALVQGDALGGGLELALSCQTMVAESGVKMGFPEVLFGLFPGMGAYSFLSRRVSPGLPKR